MKSKAFFMALLAFAFGAQAVPIDVENAKKAARAWAYRGATLGAQIGDTVERAATHRTANDVTFYAIKMKGGGTVFMSSDTEVEPVICFTSDPDADVALDPKSPLWALLNADLAVRGKVVAPVMAAGGSTAAPQSRTAKLWADLIREGDPNYIRPSFVAPITDQKKIGDLRVAPLVQSQWSQSTANSKACWNYYTPPGPDGSTKNAVCGCVATAMSQVMRYHKFPNDTVEQVKHTCTYNGNPISLTTQAGTYDWDSMTLKPSGAGGSMTAENYQAIGKLTSDAGITVFMGYTDGESGAFGFDITYALMHHWHYKNSVFFDVRDIQPQESGNANRDKAFQKALFASFDAGYPVCMGVPGHAIVADGYGYNEGLDYVHLNMGWAGQSDYWYNLPDVTKAHPAFTAVEDISYNIFPDKDKTHGIISGRLIVAETGKPCVDAEVTLKAKSGGAEVKVRTTATGVYGAAVKAGTYVISAVSSDGSKAGTLSGDVTVKAPTTSLVNWNGFGRLTPSVYEVANLGNSWGNDFTVEDVVYEGSVRNVTQGGALYGTLDAALDAAHADDEIEILSETLLRYPQAVTKNVTIRTVTGVDPATAVVHCRTAAVHGFTNVVSGATLTLENVVFANTQGCFVDVARGGKLQVGGVVGLTDADKTGGSFVRTVDSTGFVLAGVLTSYLQIKCIEAGGLNNVFGSTTLPAVAAQGCVKHLLNPDDDELSGGVNTETLALFWNRVEPEPDRAVAYFTANGGESKTYYTKLSTAINDNNMDGDIYLLKDACTLTTNAWANGRKRILCTNEIATVVTYANRHALISVNPLGSLVVSNVTFTGASHQGAFVVNGGELTLDADTLIAECANEVGTSQDFSKPSGGAVTVRAFHDGETSNPGKLTMLAGSVISNCTTKGCGGGVYVGGDWYDSGVCSFDLFGGKIVNCSAEGFGGGAYVGHDSAINVSGEATVTGCRSATLNGESVSSDNVDLSEGGTLVLAGELTGRVNVFGYTDYVSYGNENGLLFGTIAEACDETTATNSAYNFRCDVRTEEGKELRGEYVLDEAGKRMLAWSELPVPVQDVEPEYPVAWVIYDQEDGSTLTNKYGTLDEALASITDDATVEITDWYLLLSDGPGKYSAPTVLYDMMTGLVARLTKSVVIEHDVLLRTATTLGEASLPNVIWQSGRGRVTVANGGKLTLENVIFDGINPLFAVTGVTTNDGVEVTIFDYDLEQGGNSGVLEVSGEGSELILSDGALVYDFYGDASRAAAAINVVEKGALRLRDGAEVAGCINSFRKDDGQPENNPAPAGGILVNDGLLSLEGGWVHDCGAIVGGGVLAENGSRVEVSGSPKITGNYLLVGSKMPTDPAAQTNANLSVANEAVNGMPKLSELVLVGEFTGEIGILEPRLFGQFVADAEIDTNVFGKVSGELNPMNFQASAANFKRDIATGVTGKIALSGNPNNPALLVWPSALGDDGTYTDPETKEKYDDVKDFQMVDYPVPVLGLVYDGTLKTGVVEHAGYTLTGNTAIDVGEYMATATLDRKWMWSDGTVGPVKVNWKIAENPTPPPPPPPPTPTEIDPPTAVTGLIYNGNEQTGVVVSVGFTLTGNVGTNAGPYTAVATPAEGYCWTGGSTAVTNVEWSIAKATYDMSGVVFTNVTYICDGTAKSNLVDETTLPVGVSVTNYLNNGQTEIGEYTVTAQFGGDEVNYEPIADMTATLTIIEEPPPPPPTPTEIEPPTALTGLIYNGNEQTGVVVSVGFTLTGNVGTNAGPYTAVATPAEGYVWTGGSTAATNVEWLIAKATYDMSGVVFTNVTYICDGTAKSNLVDEATLPSGVSVTNYLNNGQTEIGEYTVTAQFGGDADNYEPIADMTATLTIIENPTPDPPDPPQPQWDVVTNHPGPIAFKAIERVNDTEWTLVITNRTPYCNYRLIWTTDLTKGFTSTGAWEHAVGPAAETVWTTNVITTGGAWFWRAEGADGTNMVPHQAEVK